MDPVLGVGGRADLHRAHPQARQGLQPRAPRRAQFPHLHVVGQVMAAIEEGPVGQGLADDGLQPLPRGLKIVDHPHLAAGLLQEPDGRGVVDPQVPGRVHPQGRIVRHRRDPPGLVRLCQDRAVIGAWRRGIEGHQVFRGEPGPALLRRSGLGHQVRLLPGQLLGGEDVGMGGGRLQGEPGRVPATALEGPHRVVAAPRRPQEQGPAAVLRQDRPQVGPGLGLGQGPLREHHPQGRGAHQPVVIVRARHLPDRPVLQLDPHVPAPGRGAQGPGEGLVDPPAAGVRVHRLPDRLPGVGGLRQHVPVDAGAGDHPARGPVQGHLVLAPAAVGGHVGPQAPRLQIAPQVQLVGTRCPGRGNLHQNSAASTTRPAGQPSVSAGAGRPGTSGVWRARRAASHCRAAMRMREICRVSGLAASAMAVT